MKKLIVLLAPPHAGITKMVWGILFLMCFNTAGMKAQCNNPGAIGSGSGFGIASMNFYANGGFPGLFPVFALGANYTVIGNLDIDLNYDLRGCTFTLCAGATITIKTGFSLTLTGTTLQGDLTGGGKLWHGILAEDGSIFNSMQQNGTRSLIRDALRGVTFLRNATVDIRDTDFFDNLIGIYAPAISPGHFLVILDFYGNHFERVNGGLLLPTYPGAPSTPIIQNGLPLFAAPAPGQPSLQVANFAFAGIVLFDVQYFSIPPPSVPVFGNNVFAGMSSGILCNRSYLEVRQSRFANLRQTILHNAEGFGVRADGTSIFPSNVRVIGLGTGAGAALTVEHCNAGIFGVWVSKFFVEDCRIQTDVLDNFGNNTNGTLGLGNGVRAQSGANNFGGYIQNNVINSGRDAIYCFNLTSDNFQIYNNIITSDFNGTGAVSTALAGIYLANCIALTGQNFNFNINQNTIYNIDFYMGIRAASCGGIDIYDNSVTLQNSNLAGVRGVDLANNAANATMPRVRVNCNSVYGAVSPLPSAGASAFLVFNDFSALNCNGTYDTPSGFVFNLAHSIIFKSNQIGEHANGLVINSNSLGVIQNMGNQWFGSYLAGWGANDIPSFTTFLVSAIGSPLSPVIGDFSPVSLFTQQGVADTICPFSCAVLRPDDGELPNEVEFRIAEGDLPQPLFEESANWSADEGLYGKIDKNPTWATGSPLFQDFYNQKSNEPLGRLYNTGKAMGAFWEGYAQLAPNLEAQESILSLIGQKRMDYLSAPDEATKAMVMSEINLLIQQIFVLKEANELEAGIIDSARWANTQEISIENDAIPVTEVWEQNLKISQQVRLETIERDIYTFTPEQVSALEGIVYQCPTAAGPGIVWARILYELYNTSAEYNDEASCYLEGIQYRRAHSLPVTENKMVTSHAYPNPGQSSITFTLGEPLEAQGEINIFDANGKTAALIQVLAGSATATFDVSSLPNGIYMAKATVGDTLLFVERIGVFH